MQDAPLFELQDVSKTFPPARPYFPFGRKRSEIRAVSNVSLQINHGEVFGVIGESGSGKSTLGFLMGGIERPSSGSIMFCGKALDAMDRRDRNRFCRTTQLVFQDFGVRPKSAAEGTRSSERLIAFGGRSSGATGRCSQVDLTSGRPFR